MKKLEWKKELSVGVETIDNDHKKLISITNDLIDAVTQEKDLKIILDIFDELEAYTRYHFEREEAYMDTSCVHITSIDRKHHKAQHRYFIDKLVRFRQRIESGENENQEERFAILEFLVEWLLNHIIHEDLSLNACQKDIISKSSPFTSWLSRHFTLFARARILIILPLSFLVLSAVYISFNLFKMSFIFP